MIPNEFMARIEGHGNLKVDWSKNKVNLRIFEGERLFEGILVGRTAEESHWITPRICGVCPIAHNLASLAAVEDAYGIKISESTRLLRELLSIAQMIQSHVLHIYFLALPNYIGLDRGTDLYDKDPKSFAKALLLKDLGDEIAKVVGGRNVHPTRTSVGGFHKVATKEELSDLKVRLQKAVPASRWGAKFFSKLKYPALSVDLDLVVNDGVNISSSKKRFASVRSYKENIEETVKEDSTAKFGTFQGREAMVGALARFSLLKKEVKDPLTKKLIAKLDYKNPYHNNFAQAIEIHYFILQAIKIIDTLMGMEIDNKPGVPTRSKDFVGIGAVEAPRGGLYHEIHLDKNGIITHANIITPTVQNLTSIQKSAQAVLDQHRGKSQKELERLMEMVVRAYDPCISCSVH